MLGTLPRDIRQEKDKRDRSRKERKKMKLFLVLHCYTLVPKRPYILFQMTLRANKYFQERRRSQNQHTNSTSVPISTMKMLRKGAMKIIPFTIASK